MTNAMRDPLPEAECPLLFEMYRTGKCEDPTGKKHEFAGAVSLDYAHALYGLVRREKPRVLIEVGLMRGASALAMLAGLKRNEGEGAAAGAKLISMDPGQTKWAHNVGRHMITKSGFDRWHEFIEDYDYNAMPALLARGIKADLGYIDGWHTFDYTLLDVFYMDKLLRPGGVLGINDCGYMAVHRVVNFLLTHRKYEEIDVGLAPLYSSRVPGGGLLKRLQGRNSADRYFRKLEQWEPDWNFYARF